MIRVISLFLILFSSVAVMAQSGRVPPNSPDRFDTPALVGELTLKQMFDEANGYLKAKAIEYDAKKIVFNERVLKQSQLEQRQLSAKYAAMATQRKDLVGDDFYYLGMLYWIAENLDGTADNLRNFIAFDGLSPDRRQTARSIVVVVLAKQKKLADAEHLLAEYLKSEPKKLAERAKMEGELAKAYQAQKDFARMAPHADEDFKVAKLMLNEPSLKNRVLDEIFDAGLLVFEAYRELGNQKNAETALEDLRVVAAATSSTDLYYYSVDQRVKYLIETGRKPQAQEYFLTSVIKAEKAFDSAALRTDVISRLKKREKHYKLLGEPAPELQMIDQWFPGEQKSFANMKGKVILLDFWATWCGPCYEAFPLLKEWHQDHSREGLVILGVTKYYGRVNSVAADNLGEIESLKRFRETQKLPYDFVVAKDASSQLLYGATALPTTILIDRKGVIRYAESGTSQVRLAQIREMVLKLLAEK
ncbi:MAG: TlpA family protein disulfide reductase [Chloracidobacterium sp.]|nr:TlpA family protein disulfide reductase [Chloracidobacterium sp.]